MWYYRQSDGLLLDPNFNPAGNGYSGFGAGKNNPDMQQVHNTGPIPRGDYTILEPVNSHEHGPYCLPLLADPANYMFGRFGFLIHGDSILKPGKASQGCIILARNLREQIWNSQDHRLRVVTGLWVDPKDGPK